MLLAFILIAGRVEGARMVAPGVVAGAATAVILDSALRRLRGRRWASPTGALLTGLLVAMVLSPREPTAVVAGGWGSSFTTVLGFCRK